MGIEDDFLGLKKDFSLKERFGYDFFKAKKH